jgi:hypothetical protein
MAATLTGVDRVTLPTSWPSIVHMKPHISAVSSQQWTQELVWEYHDGVLKINTVAQRGMFHYLDKSWDPHAQ